MTMQWQEELRQLAEIESPDSGAITFYFQPQIPQNLSHREEAILAKDLVEDAIQRHGRNGNHVRLRNDLQRILEIAEQLHGNHSRAKVIFACSEKEVWREFDIPEIAGTTQLHVNSRFHLKPIADAVLSARRCTIALVDREKARILDVFMDQVTEREQIADEIARNVRSDGFNGYEAGHVERHVGNGVMRHVKRVVERLLEIRTEGQMDCLVIGCRQEMWPEIEPHLHPYLKKCLIGRMTLDPAIASLRDVQEQAARLLDEDRLNEQQARIREVIGEAQRNGRGSIGLRHVLTSLERGEVQTLLIGNTFSARAVECTHCGHLDTRLVAKCAICAHQTRGLDDIGDALIGFALRGGVNILHVDDEEFAKAGNIGALLRFRADQNTPEKLAG
jgi:peptide subunit release factor 1 (eRF1)